MRPKRNEPQPGNVASTATRNHFSRDAVQEMIRQAGADSIPHVNQGKICEDGRPLVGANGCKPSG
jgi:hypothetical protein